MSIFRPRWYTPFGGGIVLFSLLSAPAWCVTDSVTIYEQGGTTTTNYPIQIGRPFVDGEITTCPQPVIGGTPAANWQADIKQTYTDGSVKHAIIAFLIPFLPANSSVTITFQNAACSNTPLTQAQMLGSGYNFDAQIQATNGATVSASARTMLTNASSLPACDPALPPCLWTSGQVAQTVLLADDSNGSTCNGHPCSAYDMGFDSNKVIRPRFYATFWPAINKVTVRYVAEIPNSQAVEDQTYSLTLTIGNSGPSTVYSLPTFTHNALARWTKTYWLGGAPSTVAIDHNLGYLTSTGAIPNFDTTLGTGAAANEATNWAAWQGVSHDPFNVQNSTSCMPGAMETANWPFASFQGGYCGAFWQTSQPAPGDRPDLGIYTGWVMNWLYTMNDYRNSQIALGQADLSASWPIYMREGQVGNNLTQGTSSPTPACTYQCSVSSLGRITSIVSRTALVSNQSAGMPISSTGWANAAVSVGTVGTTQWQADLAHLPDNWTVPYLLTGDFFYLEESYFWAEYAIAFSTPNGANYGRAGAGNLATAQLGQIRTTAWNFRTVANTWAIAPDNTPEKSYIETALNQMLASAEGMHNITGDAYYNTTAWNFGYNAQRIWTNETNATMTTDSTDVLHEWVPGNATFVYDGISAFQVNTSIGTVSTSGSSPTVTFSNSSDCNSIPVGAILTWPVSSYLTSGTWAQIRSLSCPTATLTGAQSISATTFVWTNMPDALDGPWQDSFLMATLGRTKEVFGSVAEPTVAWYSNLFTDGLTSANYNPYLMSEYISPSISASLVPNNWIASLSAKKALFNSTEQSRNTWYSTGYAENLMGAVSYIAGETNGAAAWAFMNTNERLTDTALATDTRWAIIPRNLSQGPPSPCDLNGDGQVNSLDVQIAVNQALGVTACTNAALITAGVCNILDVQIVINAALGNGCVIP